MNRYATIVCVTHMQPISRHGTPARYDRGYYLSHGRHRHAASRRSFRTRPRETRLMPATIIPQRRVAERKLVGQLLASFGVDRHFTAVELFEYAARWPKLRETLAEQAGEELSPRAIGAVLRDMAGRSIGDDCGVYTVIIRLEVPRRYRLRSEGMPHRDTPQGKVPIYRDAPPLDTAIRPPACRARNATYA